MTTNANYSNIRVIYLDSTQKGYSSFEEISDYDNIKELSISGFSGIKLPSRLPKYLEVLDCRSNRLRKIPQLPKTLKKLECDGNLLQNLPKLHEGIIELSCGMNYIKNLPRLPDSLEDLNCSFNQYLHQIPNIPKSLTVICFSESGITCVEGFTDKVDIFEISMR